jgi:predicted DCC family thiol-disulfide oxidoreductase YuxK
VRDRLYLAVARYRYRWFGKKATCLMPPAGALPRFLDQP